MTNRSGSRFSPTQTLPLKSWFIMARQPIDDQSIDLVGTFLMKKVTGSHHPMK
jgi:hypothetical protein